jgi:SAM-dependent methyltransferase
MNDPRRAFDTLVQHASTAEVLESMPRPRFKADLKGCTVLEIGPGDSLFTGIVARCMGADKSWLVDAGDFASRQPDAYARLARFLVSEGYDLPLDGCTPDALLQDCGVVYLTDGVNSLQQIPTGSVDFCFSNAVLEHVPKYDFVQFAQQLRRVINANGVCVHRVDLKDHLGGQLNNLRFSESTWEGALFRNAGFYTNRIRYNEMVEIFRAAGFECEMPRVVRWPVLPTPKSRLASAFRALSDDELRVSGFDLVLRPRGAT